jgi:hypothetical protein
MSELLVGLGHPLLPFRPRRCLHGERVANVTPTRAPGEGDPQVALLTELQLGVGTCRVAIPLVERWPGVTSRLSNRR